MVVSLLRVSVLCRSGLLVRPAGSATSLLQAQGDHWEIAVVCNPKVSNATGNARRHDISRWEGQRPGCHWSDRQVKRGRCSPPLTTKWQRRLSAYIQSGSISGKTARNSLLTHPELNVDCQTLFSLTQAYILFRAALNSMGTTSTTMTDDGSPADGVPYGMPQPQTYVRTSSYGTLPFVTYLTPTLASHDVLTKQI